MIDIRRSAQTTRSTSIHLEAGCESKWSFPDHVSIDQPDAGANTIGLSSDHWRCPPYFSVYRMVPRLCRSEDSVVRHGLAIAECLIQVNLVYKIRSYCLEKLFVHVFMVSQGGTTSISQSHCSQRHPRGRITLKLVFSTVDHLFILLTQVPSHYLHLHSS